MSDRNKCLSGHCQGLEWKHLLVLAISYRVLLLSCELVLVMFYLTVERFEDTKSLLWMNACFI